MKTLVTGGAGFIGSHVVDRLVKAGHEVVVIDDLSTGRAGNLPAHVRLIRSDISDESAVSTVASLDAELVVHCAAQASVARSSIDPTRDAIVNIIGSLNVILGAIESRARRFVYVNTGGALYGQAESIPTDERQAIRPISAYGLSKSTVEAYLALLAPTNRWWISLRLANVYGPRQLPDGEGGVVSILCDRMVAGEPVEIHGDGEQTRDFVYVTDVVDAILLALRGASPSVLNIGTGIQTSINRLFLMLAERTAYTAQPAYAPPRPDDVRHSALDPSEAHRTTGWSPQVMLGKGLDDTLAWHRAIGRGST